MSKRYEILPGLPATGPMYVTIPPDNYSEGFVVRIYKKDGSDWVGNFELAYGGLNTVIGLGQSNLIIIANGTCYVVDPESEKALDQFGFTYKNRVDALDGKVILSDNSRLTIIEPDGTYWHSEEFGTVGIEDLAINNNIVSGVVCVDYDEEWVDFTFNLATKIFTGVDFFTENYSFIEKKLWWKFW